MSNFETKYSLGYHHVICIGKTKSTSEKGLLLSFDLCSKKVQNPDKALKARLKKIYDFLVAVVLQVHICTFTCVLCKITT